MRCELEKIGGGMVRVRLGETRGLLRHDFAGDMCRMMGDRPQWSVDVSDWSDNQVRWLRNQLVPDGITTRLRRY